MPEISTKQISNIFNTDTCTQIINRIEKLDVSSAPNWGKMNVAQMLAHCNVTYEMVFDNKHKAPGFLMKFILKTFVKKIVVSEKPYAKNSQTSPAFMITDTKQFESEKERLIKHISKTKELGSSYFEGKESLSFGKLTSIEWNNMFSKHLDHHLTQFGV